MSLGDDAGEVKVEPTRSSSDSQPVHLAPSTIHLFLLRTDVPSADLTILANQLTPAERRRAERFEQLRDRQQFVVTRAALRELLSRHLDVPVPQIELFEGSGVKPRLADRRIEFNVSHSENLGVVALAQRAVGVDVEKIRPRSVGFDQLAALNFSVEEYEQFKRATDPCLQFYLTWTAKEAALKLNGTGLAAFPERFAVAGGISPFGDVRSLPPLFITSMAAPAGYCISIATADPTATLECRWFETRPGSNGHRDDLERPLTAADTSLSS